MEREIKRVFIVGCPRSGTTLLQGMLAAHPKVLSFPETHFFSIAYPRNRLKRLLTWPALNLKGVLGTIASELGREDLSVEARIGLLEGRYEAPFLKLLDRVARDAGKDVWVEKTPRHLHFLDQIGKRVPGARFIHIVREGRDVVASLYKAANEDPSRWNRKKTARKLTLADCVKRWNNDAAITARYIGSPGHFIVLYADLVEKPQEAARGLCAFLNITYMPEMIDTGAAYGKIVREQESWKANNARNIQRLKSSFETVLTPEEQRFVEGNINRPEFMRRQP